MNNLLAHELTKRGGIRKGSKLESKYRAIDISGSPLAVSIGVFSVESAKLMNSGKVIFETTDISGKPKKIDAEDVIAIEGMDPDRVAEMHGFIVSENQILPFKKRAKSPKDDIDDDDNED